MITFDHRGNCFKRKTLSTHIGKTTHTVSRSSKPQYASSPQAVGGMIPLSDSDEESESEEDSADNNERLEGRKKNEHTSKVTKQEEKNPLVPKRSSREEKSPNGWSSNKGLVNLAAHEEKEKATKAATAGWKEDSTLNLKDPQAQASVRWENGERVSVQNVQKRVSDIEQQSLSKAAAASAAVEESSKCERGGTGGHGGRDASSASPSRKSKAVQANDSDLEPFSNDTESGGAAGNPKLQEAQFKQRRAELALTQLKRSIQKYADGYMEKVVVDAELEESSERLEIISAQLQLNEYEMRSLKDKLTLSEQEAAQAKQEVAELRANLQEAQVNIQILRTEHEAAQTELLIRQQENSRLVKQYSDVKRDAVELGFGFDRSRQHRGLFGSTHAHSPERGIGGGKETSVLSSAQHVRPGTESKAPQGKPRTIAPDSPTTVTHLFPPSATGASESGSIVVPLAKLQGDKHKYHILRQTADEWRRELERKQEECAMWRKRSSWLTHGLPITDAEYKKEDATDQKRRTTVDTRTSNSKGGGERGGGGEAQAGRETLSSDNSLGNNQDHNLFRTVLLSSQMMNGPFNPDDEVSTEAFLKLEEDIEEQIFLMEPHEIMQARHLLDQEMPNQPLAVTRMARRRLNDILEKKNIACSTALPPKRVEK